MESSSLSFTELLARNITLIAIVTSLAVLLVVITIRFERKLKSFQTAEHIVLADTPFQDKSYMSDFHLRTWLSKFRQTSIKHLLKMGLFYHSIGFAFGIGETILIEELDPFYETPNLLLTLFDALSAGPIEEALLFGFPFTPLATTTCFLELGVYGL
ncbi:hypothetical protein [Candidatus Nitrososphaera gargensis]|uniref:hypothetical protein n=1 Tax=Candidatus Nitrososphaera gargensis TaxID=497727 RepID=UPI0011E5174B|nr:hypothetical protein [Candidatus Nitrososphaera gargensis]